MTDSNVVSLKAITPPRWDGELTTGLLDMYVTGLMNASPEMGRRLAYELKLVSVTLYNRVGLLLAAEAEIERLKQQVVQVFEALEAHEDYCNSDEKSRETAYNRFTQLKLRAFKLVETQKVASHE